MCNNVLLCKNYLNHFKWDFTDFQMTCYATIWKRDVGRWYYWGRTPQNETGCLTLASIKDGLCRNTCHENQRESEHWQVKTAWTPRIPKNKPWKYSLRKLVGLKPCLLVIVFPYTNPLKGLFGPKRPWIWSQSKAVGGDATYGELSFDLLEWFLANLAELQPEAHGESWV